LNVAFARIYSILEISTKVSYVDGNIEAETANVFLKIKPTSMYFSFASECNH